MKKTYIAPTINVVNVQSTLLCGSLGVDQDKTTTSQYSRYNNVNFIDDDEDDYATGW